MPTLLPYFRDELAEAAERQAVRRRSMHRRAPAAAVAVVALVVTAALTLADAGGRLDVVGEARAAIASSGGEIIRTLTVRTTQRPGAAPVVSRVESWSATNPRRWRLAFDGLESVLRDDEVRTYRAGKVVGVQPLRTTNDGLPGLSLLAHDPVSGLRKLLDAGQLRDGGTVEVGGRTLRRLTGEFAAPPMGEDMARTMRVSYDVDPEQYTPVAITVQAPDLAGTVQFERFERLAATPDNLDLLEHQSGSAQRG